MNGMSLINAGMIKHGMSLINAGINLSQQYLEHLLNLCQEELLKLYILKSKGG
jgi:hypothetical protein